MRLARLCFVLCVFLQGTVLAQPPGFSRVDNPAEFSRQFATEGKKIGSIQSLFEQEKNLAVLEEKILSTGKFFYKREKKVRIEYQKPFRYLMIINNDLILIRDDKKENRLSAHSNKLFQQVNKIIVDCINGSILENKDFKPTVYQDEKTYLLEMAPVSKSMRNFFTTIGLQLDKKDWSVASITLSEPGGDYTIIRFTDKVLNEEVDDALFAN